MPFLDPKMDKVPRVELHVAVCDGIDLRTAAPHKGVLLIVYRQGTTEPVGRLLLSRFESVKSLLNLIADASYTAFPKETIGLAQSTLNPKELAELAVFAAEPQEGGAKNG